jgi:lincosamide nucleotidyltransferase A/C/D/E
VKGADVLFVVDELRRAGVTLYVAGGWGVDALVGRQTRAHADLDLSFDATQDTLAVRRMRELGFATELDQRPTRLVMLDTHGRVVDLHPVQFAADGSGVLPGFNGEEFHYPADGFTTGRIAGRNVPCISAELQMRFHLGYQHRDVDRQDVATLRRHLRRGPALAEP